MTETFTGAANGASVAAENVPVLVNIRKNPVSLCDFVYRGVHFSFRIDRTGVEFRDLLDGWISPDLKYMLLAAGEFGANGEETLHE